MELRRGRWHDAKLSFGATVQAAVVGIVVWLAVAGLPARATPGSSSGGLPIDSIRIEPAEQGRLELSAGLELVPSGWETLVAVGDTLISYAEASHQAIASIGVRYTLVRGLSVSAGISTGLVHQREAWDGGGQSQRLLGTALRVSSAGLRYDTPRSPRGSSLGIALSGGRRASGIEVSLSQIRDPLVLFGSLFVARDARAPDPVNSVGLGVGAAFVANERVTLRASWGVTSPFTGVRAPASALSWRVGYLLDVAGDREIAAFGSWTNRGHEIGAKIGVEWNVVMAK